jgi:predicted alpha/beta superfamily hydrolase
MKFLVVQLFLGISFSFTYSQAVGQIPFVLGIVDEIHSVILSENRILNIYLPPEYDGKDSMRYAVIYLLDGSADEDFIHVSGLVQFNTLPLG